MRPRWRSRGAGPDGCIHRGPRRACAMGWFLGPQRERRTAAAELVGSRGMTARGQGKKVGRAVAGQGPTGARPAQKRGRLGASPHDRQRSTLAVGASSACSAPPVRRPPAVTATMPLDPTTHQPRPTRHGPCRARCRCRIRSIGRESRFRCGPAPIRPGPPPGQRARKRSAHPVP